MTPRPALATSVAALALLLGAATSASAAPEAAPWVDREVQVLVEDGVGSSGVPDDLRLFTSEVAHLGLSMMWDAPTGHLQVVLSPGQSDEEVLAAARAQGVADRVTIVRAPFSLEDLTALASELVSSGEAQWAGPAPDLSGVDIGVRDAELSAFTEEPAPGPGTDGIPARIVDVGEMVAISGEDFDATELGGDGEASPSDEREGGALLAWGGGVIALAILAGGVVAVRRPRR